MGVMDGLCPVDFETDSDKEKRKVGQGSRHKVWGLQGIAGAAGLSGRARTPQQASQAPVAVVRARGPQLC
jgi:hypothetical protein